MQFAENLVESGEDVMLSMSTRIWAVGGGKGGVGKSFITANLAVGLAALDQDVIVVDTDLGGANMHTVLGVANPTSTLADFLENRCSSLEEILITTPIPRVKLLCGASDVLSLANPQYSQKMKLMRHLGRLNADHILLDLGAGTTYNVLDFFNLAQEKLIVITPEPTSIQNGYGFLKSALLRHLFRQFNNSTIITDLLKNTSSGAVGPQTIKQVTQAIMQVKPEMAAEFEATVHAYHTRLVLNMTPPEQAAKVFSVVRSVSRGFLSLDVELVGAVSRDDRVQRSVDQMQPVLRAYPESESARQVRQLIDKLATSLGLSVNAGRYDRKEGRPS